MFTDKIEKSEIHDNGKKNIAVETVNVLEELITAFLLTLLIVVFLVRPYIIPTGSMADTLKGAHFRLRCLQCGWKYEVNFIPREYGLGDNVIPRGKVRLGNSRCPNCGHYQLNDRMIRVTKGDKILAVKCIYQFFEPKQWDVVVFKSPMDPKINFIKRLAGRPGETVEIMDGDVYINGQISRKPRNTQNDLWMPIYNNDYQPVRPLSGIFNGHIWKQPFDVDNSMWAVDKEDPTKFVLNTDVNQMSTLVYDGSVGNDFRATYAYDDVRTYHRMPYCSDIKLQFEVNSGFNGTVGIALSKYGHIYKALLNSSGTMIIAAANDKAKNLELARKQIDMSSIKKDTPIEFVNVDHELIFKVGDELLTHDLGRGSDAAGKRRTDILPQAKILGAGNLVASHVAISRDIHYTRARNLDGSENTTASEGNPLILGDDEFFVLGDNSPASLDGRLWDQKGIGNNGVMYRRGIVPREYLIGKAVVVFWPSGFRPVDAFPFALIPDIGKMRAIYGGK